MSSPETFYRRVYASLKAYSDELNSIDAAINTSIRNCKAMCERADSMMQEELKQNAEKEVRLKAFIDIARSHCKKLIDSQESYQYDTGVLSRLSVQINNSSRNDLYASQLYTQATGQLRFVRTDVSRIQLSCEETKRNLEKRSQIEQLQFKEKRDQLCAKIAAYFYSDEFKAFVETIRQDYSIYGNDSSVVLSKNIPSSFVSIGTKRVMLPVPTGFSEYMVKATQGFFDVRTGTVGIPVCIDMTAGKGMIIDYVNESEGVLLSGLHNYLLNIARYYGQGYDQIVYVDPVRFNNSSLGILQPLTEGKDAFIDSVPLSIESIRKKLTAVIASINAEERNRMNGNDGRPSRRLMIFHNFPQMYDSTMVSQIQQLFVNAAHYNLTVIATHNCSTKNVVSNETLAYLRTVADTIQYKENRFILADVSGEAEFRWYKAPESLPSDIRRKYIDEKPIVDTSNDYEKRLGLDLPRYKKGVRKLTNIPYGIDQQGNILTLDLENSNFATFICGAARSGKSTLLHTLITGIIANNHPDDVELWLIDFKMTEFSRYINHLPPHVRYIILDESPELVYDIIDRLTEILIKRQNAFKGKWLKLDDVPPDKYMPAILVIIDEFSVMSQIIADSLASSKENYAMKLQTLLAKGAALGLHFIFASQGFTSGTRGLNDFSKKQVQQRIAMKTEYNEIKETLDLKSASDDDKAMMEQLPVHHALVRTPVDERGNHIKLTQVMYIQDYTHQEAMIDRIRRMVHPAPRYDANDTSVYIDKRSMVIDGNNYLPFDSKRSEINDMLQKNADLWENGDEAMLFVGEPRRMLPFYPIEMLNGFCENLLMVASLNETDPAASVLLSVSESLVMQQKGMELWSVRKNAIFRKLSSSRMASSYSVSKDLDDICDSIRRIKKEIESKRTADKYIIILGLESLIMDMSYQDVGSSSQTYDTGSYSLANAKFEKREPNEPDLLTQLDDDEFDIPESGNQESAVVESNVQGSRIKQAEKRGAYDAKTDLKFIFTQGPRLGYHFLIVFNTVGELNQARIDTSLFRHRILFRLPRTEAAEIIGASGAGVVAELEDHSFRYSNGLDELSFRPYLHRGLSWNGWKIGDSGAAGVESEEEEYLM